MAAKLTFIAVTSSNTPYLYDTPNVLSLPKDAEFRFRYQEKWTEPEFLPLAGRHRDHFKGTKVILVFHSEASGSLVPLREVEVVRVEVLGPVVYVRFKVGRFFKPPDSAIQDPTRALAESTRQMSTLLELPTNTVLTERLPLGHYFRRVPAGSKPPEWNEAVDSNSWWRVVSLFRKEPSVEKLPFFFVLGLASANGRPHGWTGLSQGGRYRLRVLEWCFERGTRPVAKVSCFSSPDLLVLEAASNLVVGQYDVIDFDFVATKRGKGQLAIALTREGIETQAVGADAGQSSGWPQSFHTIVPIAVKFSWGSVLARFSVGLVGAILFWQGLRLGSDYQALQSAGLLLFVVAMGSFGEKAVTAGKDVREFAKKPVE